MQGSPYRNNFGPDSVEELKNNINSTHADFLREDDPIKKADALRYMSAYAMQFLYVVPHDQKFIFKETERVLHQSAMNIDAFDPREASIAFEYVGRYAQNILDQPWRKDFHTIKLTSGFYVHNISAQLSNAHEILVSMGYVHVDENTLKVVPKLDEKRIKNVSRDMVVASQECLILSQIWQRVADQEPDYPLTIGEVFEFRRQHLGDTDAICRTMLMDIRKRQHNHDDRMQHRRCTKGSSTTGKDFVPVDKLIDYEEMDIDSRDGSGGGGGIDEVEAVQKVLKHTRLLHDKHKPPSYGQDDEHIYDPVYSGPSGLLNGGGLHSQSHNYTSSYPRSGGSSAFVPLAKPEYSGNQQQYSGRESVNSPLIPQTVSNFNSRSDSSYSMGRRLETGLGILHQLPSLSSGASSGSTSSSSMGMDARMTSQASNKNNYAVGTNSALKFSKVSPDEMSTWDREKVLRSRKPESQHGTSTTIAWSEWAGHSNVEEPVKTHRRRHSERPVVAESYRNDNNSRSRKPIMPSDVYPDDCFPRVVKPTPVHCTTQQQPRLNNHHPGSSSSFSNRQLPPSPKASSPAAETRLDSLDTLYYKKLLHDNFGDDSSFTGNEKMPSSSNAPAEDRREITPPREKKPTLCTTGTSTSTNIDEDLNFNTVSGQSSRKPMQDKQIISPTTSQPKIAPWNCRFCTFKNKISERICEMCAKSNDFFDEEEEDAEGVNVEKKIEPTAPPPPEASAPPPSVPKLYSPSLNPNKTSTTGPTLTLRDPNMLQCPHCTLLNPCVLITCEACGNRLRIDKAYV